MFLLLEMGKGEWILSRQLTVSPGMCVGHSDIRNDIQCVGCVKENNVYEESTDYCSMVKVEST